MSEQSSAANGTITIAIVDDHRLVRQCLSDLLKREPDLRVVGEAANGREAVDLARRLKPSVMLMDIGMPVMDGIEATRRITAEQPGIRILGLSVRDEKHYIANILRAGASGFVLKDSLYTELVPAIRDVARDSLFISQRVMESKNDFFFMTC